MGSPHLDRRPRVCPRRLLAAALTTLATLAATSACERAGERPAAAPGDGARSVAATDGGAEPLDYTAPPDSLIPDDSLGAAIRRGRALFLHTADSLPAYAPANVRCVSCHLDAGRRAGSAPLAGVMARYPAYLERAGAVVTIHDRVNFCFTRSLAGTRLPSDSREMADMVAYMAWLSQGVPHGAQVRGQGMPKMPPLVGDSARGAALYVGSCASCHGMDGQGIPPVYPALWGARSYSIGASMAREERAASFIKHNMPFTAPGTLTDQQAYDLAAYINSQPRPDLPGKERDWPLGGAPADTPYDTEGHAAYRPPSRLLPRADPERSLVPPPPRAGGAAGVSGGGR